MPRQPSGEAPRLLGLSFQTIEEMAGAAARTITRTVLPETCAGCGVSGTWMCTACSTRLGVVDQSRVCPRCGYPGRYHDGTCHRCVEWALDLAGCRSAFEFHGPIRSAIHLLKYRNQPARAAWCATAMAEHLLMDQWQVDLLVPVPLHPSRVSVRGYNQSERIATELSRLSGIPMARAIARHRSTSSQVGLSGSERRVNVLGAFRYEMSLEGLSVALIDDVVTTGSTIVESARACTSAGASVVVAATLATEIQDH